MITSTLSIYPLMKKCAVTMIFVVKRVSNTPV